MASASLNAARGPAGGRAGQNRRFSLSFSQGVSHIYSPSLFMKKRAKHPVMYFLVDDESESICDSMELRGEIC